MTVAERSSFGGYYDIREDLKLNTMDIVVGVLLGVIEAAIEIVGALGFLERTVWAVGPAGFRCPASQPAMMNAVDTSATRPASDRGFIDSSSATVPCCVLRPSGDGRHRPRLKNALSDKRPSDNNLRPDLT